MLYFTIITENFLAHARQLCANIRRVDAGADFWAVIVDAKSDFHDSLGGFECKALGGLVPGVWFSAASYYYTAVELCCAARPYVHAYIYREKLAERWLYLDADIVVMAPLNVLFDENPAASVYICPHQLYPESALDSAEKGSLEYGSYNGGLLGMRHTADTLVFITWLCDRLREDSFELWRGQYLDQAWMDQARSYFSCMHRVKNPGINVGYWNLHERAIREDKNGCLWAGEEPLRALHLSHWNSRFRNTAPPNWIAKPGADMLVKHAASHFESVRKYVSDEGARPYRFSVGTAGHRISRAMRRGYFMILKSEAGFAGSPFACTWRARSWALRYMIAESRVLLSKIRNLWLASKN